MLSFAVEFPVAATSESKKFLEEVRTWILGSPHYGFVSEDLAGITSRPDWSAVKPNASVHTLRTATPASEAVALKLISVDREIEWETVAVFFREGTSAWISVRTSSESRDPGVRLPPPKKPRIAGDLLNALGGGQDGPLVVSRAPIILSEGDVPLAASLILGKAGCHLPVVYVSRGFQEEDDEYHVDLNALAHDLYGAAHVVVEPSRRFSRALQPLVSSANVYGGTVGIYWPRGGRRRSFFRGSAFLNSADMKRAIIEDIRNALMNRRPRPQCTWAAVQQTVSQEALKKLEESGSNELRLYTENFDTELNALKEELKEKEETIERLKEEIEQVGARIAADGIVVIPERERNLYEGELAEIIRDALEIAINNVPNDSRREHVLKDLLKSIPVTKGGDNLRERLKEALRDYRSMDSKVKRVLEDIGFEITDEGKHYKLTYEEDDRYTFTLPRSGGDRRGGLNAASDIAKRLF